MSELKITQEKVTAAFSEANDCPKAISILTALFGKQKPDYTDYHNIKTYEDACEAIGVIVSATTVVLSGVFHF